MSLCPPHTYPLPTHCLTPTFLCPPMPMNACAHLRQSLSPCPSMTFPTPTLCPLMPTHSLQGSQVSIYVSGRGGHQLVEGYPRALQEELGVPKADAAFTCPRSAELYVITGGQWMCGAGWGQDGGPHGAG